MRVHIPLSAKILAWFLLNLLILALSFVLLFKASIGFDTIFSALAKPQVLKIAKLVGDQLESAPRGKWNEVLDHYASVYHMQISLFHNDGKLLAGNALELPQQVLEPLHRGHLPPHLDGPPPPDEPPRKPPPVDQRTQMEDVNTLFFVHTKQPTAYWSCARIPLLDPSGHRFMPVTLVMRSDSLSAGGMFFEPTLWIVAAFGAVLLSMLFWFPLVHGITHALSSLKAATARIADGDFSTRVPEGRQDEIGALGSSINLMADKLVAHANGQRRFLGDIAHELCSPLARMQATAGLIEHQISLEVNQRHAQRLNRELRHMSDLVNELLSFSKASEKRNVELQPVRLAPLLRRVLEREGGFDGSLDGMEKMEVLAEPELLARAVGNVLRNAMRYAGDDVPIHIEAEVAGEHVIIRISDEGPGVPEEALARLCDAFYRPDPARARETGGAGLGLAIVKSCIEACHGTVSVKNVMPHGLEVSLCLLNAGA